MTRIFYYYVELKGDHDETLTNGQVAVDGKWSDYQAHQIARAEVLDSLYRSPEFSENGDYYGLEPIVTVRLRETLP
jgi:hypothetical protein